MSEFTPKPDAPPDASPSGGVGLLYNATESAIISIAVAQGPSQDETLAGFALFPVSQPTGTSVISGCSFPLPAEDFTVTVNFQSGERVTASISTTSQAAPALFIVAFLNGFVVARPTGEATSLAFSRGLDGIVAGV